MNSIYILIYIFGVLISSIAQIMLKKAAQVSYANKIKEYLNSKTIFAYFIFFLATVVTVFAYKGIPLIYGALIGTSEYIFVTVFSGLFLKEKISKKKVLGLVLIIVGIIFFVL